MHEDGHGVTQNYQEARRLYALASAQDNAEAAKYLKELDIELEEKIHAECPLLGNQVVVTCTSRRDLNGKTGAVASFDHARGRYVVVLDKQAAP